MVGTWISTSGKDPGGICSASRSLMNTSPFAFPPSEPEPICVQQNVPSQNFRSKRGNSATSGFRLLIGLSHPIIEDGADLHARRTDRRPSGDSSRSHPAAFVAGTCDAPDRDGVGRI